MLASYPLIQGMQVPLLEGVTPHSLYQLRNISIASSGFV